MSQPCAARGYETSTSASRALRVAERQAFGLPWTPPLQPRQSAAISGWSEGGIT
jgi:hypothetical protein